MKLYDELVSWYPLLDPVEEHEEETATFRAAFEAAVRGPLTTFLELGSGAGHNAFYFRDLTCTLSDLSEPMLALSDKLNPDADHVPGDMRSLRLGRTFDAVLVHDAITYMTTEHDLRAALETAFVHTRPGGAAIIATDCVRETFGPNSDITEGDDETNARHLRGMEDMWDPDPTDTTYRVDYVFLLREGNEVRVVHDHHIEGLFPLARWRALLEEVGFEVEVVTRPLPEEEGRSVYTDKVFVCRRAET